MTLQFILPFLLLSSLSSLSDGLVLHRSRSLRRARSVTAAAIDAQEASSSSSSSPPPPPPPPALGEPVCVYEQVVVHTSSPGPPAQEITVEDLTPFVTELVERSGVREGTVTVVSRHTTTGVTINEWESRLVRDVRNWLLLLAPPDVRSAIGDKREKNDGAPQQYLHNDIHLRPDSDDERQRCIENGWDVENDPEALAKWRAQEPINAHSHLMAMLLGSSEAIPVHGGKTVLGQWQSVMLVDLDGPRDRTVGIQVTGFK